jgi:uncharacterized protein YndB with AHSA1/START domain
MNPPVSLTLERVFAAPRELVFRAWAEPQRFAQWWGPHGLVLETCDFDPCRGGDIHISMRLPDGQLHHIVGRFTEVEAPALIAFDGKAITEQGEVLVGSETRVAFADDAGGTRLTLALRVTTPIGPSDLRQMEESWVEILEKLAANVSETRV